MKPTVRLINGDCLEVLPTLDRGSIDAVVTDPPYGIGYAGSQSVGGTPGRKKAYWREWRTSWDEQRISEQEVLAIRDAAAKVVMWGGNYYSDWLPVSGGWLVWDKTQRGLSFGDGELAWTNALNSVRIFSLNRCHVNLENKQHPSQKPVALMSWCFEKLKLKPGMTVLDPYMGSGTTGVAAVRAGLNFIGIELDPAYYAIAEKRINAELASTPLLDAIEARA